MLSRPNFAMHECFVPYLADSDEMINMISQVNEFNHIRRWQCKNCIRNNMNPPFIFIINNCCYPSQS